ncbi:uncharacterized protein LOC110019336 [Phalaenopsis equestris]|uniref:uncharacterized protein LOC110019336 n=1 Tax=Phalaenopsis equestris TaxID=78828 RepID=UPI0009E345C8|nr:uncharacterized protein LOC110019336 [Phalaenopsis equestris]
MEFSNMLDLHTHPEQRFFLHASTSPDCTHGSLLNGIELIPTSGDEQHVIDPVSLTTSHHHIFQDLGFQWGSHCQTSTQQLSSEVKHEDHTQLDELSSYQLSRPPLIHGSLGFDHLCYGTLLPGVNMQTAYMASMETSLGLDMEALDTLSSTRYGRIAPCQSSNINGSINVDNMSYELLHQWHHPAHGGFMNLQEIPTSINGGLTDGKGANCSSLDHLRPSKKPRFDPRPSLPPFKVRKEKLGDRIAALQQLVAPFGKTDTASVLMEAIGYIKFLQDQVETLSVPYMRSSNNKKKLSTIEEVSTSNERDGSKPDLRSRGLCLVPLSCTSYVTNDNAIWSPPNFR